MISAKLSPLAKSYLETMIPSEHHSENKLKAYLEEKRKDLLDTLTQDVACAGRIELHLVEELLLAITPKA